MSENGRFNDIADDMADQSLAFLYSGRFRARAFNDNVKAVHFTGGSACQRYRQNAFLLAHGSGFYHVFTVAGRRNSEEDIPFRAKSLNLAGKQVGKAIIITDGSKNAGICRQGNGR